MQFKMWSLLHIAYILSPFIIFALLFLLLRKRSDATKHVIGIIIGVLSISILVVRNVDIYLRSGWGVEVIPLQVCHIGSLIVGFALIFRKKWLLLISFCFNLTPAILAMVFADSLANYDTLFKIRPQTYIWGHILIVVGAFYGLFLYKNNFNKSDLFKSFYLIIPCLIIAIICNSVFRACLGWEPNYFYLFNHKGTPLKFLYTATPPSKYGWFEINWLYTLTLITVFIGVYLLFYLVAKLISKKIFKQS